jgi:hypothetical protein
MNVATCPLGKPDIGNAPRHVHQVGARRRRPKLLEQEIQLATAEGRQIRNHRCPAVPEQRERDDNRTEDQPALRRKAGPAYARSSLPNPSRDTTGCYLTVGNTVSRGVAAAAAFAAAVPIAGSTLFTATSAKRPPARSSRTANVGW